MRVQPGLTRSGCLVTIPVCPGVEIQGHHDVVATQDGQRVMLDIKTMNDKSLHVVAEEGNLRHPPQLRHPGLLRTRAASPLAGIAGWNKNNCEYHVEVFPTDGALVQEATSKAAFITTVSRSPRSREPPRVVLQLPCGFFGRECNG